MLIHRDIGYLEGFGGLTFAEVADDFVRMNTVERLLEKIITRAIDVNQHLISELAKGNEQVKGYEDTF